MAVVGICLRLGLVSLTKTQNLRHAFCSLYKTTLNFGPMRSFNTCRYTAYTKTIEYGIFDLNLLWTIFLINQEIVINCFVVLLKDISTKSGLTDVAYLCPYCSHLYPNLMMTAASFSMKISHH